MAVLCLFLLLLAYFGLSAGGETCAWVYVAPGGTALLQLSDSEVALCPGNCVFVWKKNWSKLVAKIIDGVEVQRCQPNCQAFATGSLELSEVTPEDTGDYSVEVDLQNGNNMFYKCFRLQIQETMTAITTGVTVNTTTKPTKNSTTCGGGGACECRSRCILWSSLVGAGLLILIALPLVIDCLYPVPRKTRL